MALFPKTPGVYIQEIPTLAPSVVPVATAVPVFIGYTEKAMINGKQWNYSTNKATDPVRIESLLDYEAIFGGAYIGGQYSNQYQVTITNVGVSLANNYLGYNLYTNLQMFYANGGGNCYIISVGSYLNTISGSDIIDAIAKAEKADEITLVVIPEATDSTIASSFKDINDAMLAHCAKMQDRFAIMDVKHGASNTIATDASNFRDNNVGTNNLSYGASYYPPLNTSLIQPFRDYNVQVTDNRTSPVYTDPYTNLYSILNGKAAYAIIIPGAAVANDTITINSVQFKAGVDFAVGVASAAVTLRDAINNHPTLSTSIVAVSAGHSSGYLGLLAKNSDTAGTNFPLTASNTAVFYLPAAAGTFVNGTGGGQDTALYNSILSLINANTLTLHPGATMAGIYSAVDKSRGVWKAPANVSLSRVASLSVTMTDADQAGLNVDATGGKSINAMRNFPGRGLLVWGARTLDGNSNEWRYINVRRLFIMAEESCKKASEFVVFEPNDKNTWIQVKASIGSFLTGLWRDGALTGDKPDQAYFVKVGLGETMTAQDILEGRMIVQIGLAAVRPAEFIILQFEHKLQEA